jgi:uncharacterized protein YndB with AHSA1/START domain
MAVTSVDKDYDNLQLILTADFDAPIDRVWQLWADPRKLERWWGPPEWPATFEQFDFAPGGKITYFMTGPDGEKAGGWWTVEEVNPPTTFGFTDGFSDPEGNPVDTLPTTSARAVLETTEGGTRMTLTSQFASREQMDELEAMGMVEGMTSAAGQMDAILAE